MKEGIIPKAKTRKSMKMLLIPSLLRLEQKRRCYAQKAYNDPGKK